MNLNKLKPKKGNVLILKVLPADLKARGGFQWPESGYVVAPDWEPSNECRKGLHGWLWGAGNTDVVSETVLNGEDSKWLIMERSADGIVDLQGKVKFQDCEVRFCGNKKTAIEIMQAFAPAGMAVMFNTATAGDYGTAYAGDYGTATAGYKGTAYAGYKGTATAGDYGTAYAGYKGTATARDYGTATAWYNGTATAGYKGTATAWYKGTAYAGDYGTATAGYYGTAYAGDYGTATAGYYGTAYAGYKGTATAGDYGCIVIQYYDGEQYRRKMAMVDGVTILPGVKYRLNAAHEFEAVN